MKSQHQHDIDFVFPKVFPFHHFNKNHNIQHIQYIRVVIEIERLKTYVKTRNYIFFFK